MYTYIIYIYTHTYIYVPLVRYVQKHDASALRDHRPAGGKLREHEQTTQNICPK